MVSDVFVPFLGLFGLAIGSFLGAAAHRVPRGESLVRPGSHCPACGHALAFWENVPLLSYLLLRGRCSACGIRITLRYPAMEALTGLLFAAAAARFGPTPELAPALLMISILILVSFIDLERRIIPNKIVLPGIAAGLALTLLAYPDTPLRPFVGIVAGGGLFFLLAVIKPAGLGGGDVKLAAFLGVFLGSAVLLALFVGVMAGAVVGVALMVLGIKGRKDPIPFGPFLSLGGLVALLGGPEIIRWYLGLGG